MKTLDSKHSFAAVDAPIPSARLTGIGFSSSHFTGADVFRGESNQQVEMMHEPASLPCSPLFAVFQRFSTTPWQSRDRHLSGFSWQQVAAREPHNGLAISPFHSLCSESMSYVGMRCPTLAQKTPVGHSLCNDCATRICG